MRDVPYEPEELCEICGRKGAFDFMGDLICPRCMSQEEVEELDELEDENEEGIEDYESEE
jgi:uncharacterized Zn finger protein (UPF0148 family)